MIENRILDLAIVAIYATVMFACFYGSYRLFRRVFRKGGR